MRNAMISAKWSLLIATVLTISAPVLHAQWATSGANIYNSNAGNVGVGTTAPVTKLHVAGAPASMYFQHTGALANNNAVSGILAFTDSSGAEYAWFGDGSGSVNFMTLYAGTTHGLSLYAGGNNVIYIPTNGNVGIGTTAPTYKLHVVGNAHVTGTLTGGNIAATYQDLAEWVPATSELEAGTVVVLNPEKNNEVMASARSYDTAVAGVVSERPGVILGVEGEDKEMIATTGRVKVRVDATAAPIRVGDLLVTSDKPGFAMKSRPVDMGGIAIHRPGTIIGKALQPLTEGQGEILVLLSMQ